MDGEILEFVDNGFSGTNFDRPNIHALLALVQERKINCVIVKDFSRFGRNALETGYYLERIFPLYGVRFVSLADGYDSQSYQEDTGGLLVSFKFLMAEYYSKDLSQKITSAARERMKRGERITKRCSFGYRKDGDNLVPDEQTAPTIQRIFGLADEGTTIRGIAKILHDEGYIVPTVHRGERPFDDLACIWSPSALDTILQNEQYTGTYVAGKMKVEQFGSKKRVPVPESEWIKIPNHHPAIVSKAQFERVQARLKHSYRRQDAPSKTANKKKSPLTGKVYCGYCGHKLHHYHGKTSHFSCLFTNHIRDAKCYKLRVTADHLEAQVFEELLLHLKQQSPFPEPETTPTSQGEAQTLYEAFVNGDIDAETYQKQKSLVSKAKKKEHSPPKAVSYTLKEKSLTPELVEEWVDKVSYFPDGHFEVQWKEPIVGKNPA